MPSFDYIIAKHVPDPVRDEPRNVGVIVASHGDIVARFIGEKEDDPGEVDGRKIPGWVSSSSAYKQWIKFWREEIEDTRSLDASIEVSSLRQWNKVDFLLSDSGQIALPNEEAGTIEAVADDLYRRLVTSEVEDDADEDPSLKARIRQLVRATGIGTSSNWRDDYPVSVDLGSGKSEQLSFHHGYVNGGPKKLYHRVHLSPRESFLEKNLHDATWRFHLVKEQGILDFEDLAAFVYAPTEEVEERTEVEEALETLLTQARVLNLAEPDEVQDELRALGEH